MVGFLLVGAILVAALLLLVGIGLVVGDAPGVSDGSVVVIPGGRDYPETLPYAPFLFMDAGLDFHRLIAGIRRAAEDPRIPGIHLRIEAGGLGWGRARELRDAVVAARAAGKRVTASLDYAGPQGIYLASAASRITMHPRGQLALTGLHVEVLYYGELLEKLGVEAQFEAIGPWKTAPEIYTRSSMTEANRTQITALGEAIRQEIVAAMSEGRGLDPAEAAGLLAGGPWTASSALEAGLVDGLEYHDAVEADLVGKGTGRLVSVEDYVASLTPTFAPADARIAVVHLDGAIAPGRSREDVVLGRIAGVESLVEALEELEEDDSVDAVVLRIASPGGLDTASDSVWRAAQRVRDTGKPLLASFGDVAASGGYWVATAAERVVATPLTTTGSIGVFAGKFAMGGLFEHIGVSAERVDLGGSPGWSSLAAPLDDEERARLREGLEETYEAFLERVATARGMTTDEVRDLAGGRVYSGAAALTAGLVDEFGGLTDAVRLAATAAGFPEDATTETIHLPEPPTFGEALEAEFANSFPAGASLRDRFPLLAAALQGARLTLLPFIPDFR